MGNTLRIEMHSTATEFEFSDAKDFDALVRNSTVRSIGLPEVLNRVERVTQTEQNPLGEHEAYSSNFNKVYYRPERSRDSGVISLVDVDKGWKAKLKNRFAELRNLENGWDGYRGVALDGQIEAVASSLLGEIYDPRVAPPSLVPGGDGSLQIEWHVNNCDLEIDVLSPEEVVAYMNNQGTGFEEEISVGENREKLSGWVRQLVA